MAMFSRYAIQLVPIMTGAGALHSSVFTSARDNGSSNIAAHAMGGCASGALAGGLSLVSINGAIGGCMLLGATGATGALYKHARRVPGTETGARAEDLSSTVAAGGRV